MPGDDHSGPLTRAERKRLLALACALDRVEFRLLYGRNRRSPVVLSTAISQIWPWIALAGGLSRSAARLNAARMFIRRILGPITGMHRS
jgi:hypothetical protein